MEQFVRYLFEYKENQRIRNTGFVKVQKSESKTIVHIHGQGFRLVSEQKMKVYVYEMEGEIPVGIYQGEIENINPSIHYILTFSPEDIGDIKEYRRICGILLRTESGRIFAASWNDMPFNAGAMVVRTEEARELEPTFTEAMMQEVIRDEKENHCEREERTEKENCAEQKNSSEKVSRTERDCMEEKDECEPSDAKAEREDVHREKENCAEQKNSSEGMSRTEEDCPKEMNECKQSGAKTEHEDVRCENENPDERKKPTVRRITRQDIAMLPRCEWKLANNSFLLHGYYNYHYLVLIEDGEGLWLGVPGIYHSREEKAAQNFGFSSFVQVEDSETEPFGYWCRKVKQRIHS